MQLFNLGNMPKHIGQGGPVLHGRFSLSDVPGMCRWCVREPERKSGVARTALEVIDPKSGFAKDSCLMK